MRHRLFSLQWEWILRKERNDILYGLGPHFIDWWGSDPLTIDADLLPEVVPN